MQSASPFDSTAEVDAGLAPAVTQHTQPPATARTEVELAPGEVLGDYRIEAKIGQGGMGTVYLGVHQLIGKRAAIKVLRGESCADQNEVDRFIAEARVVNEIGHPNIVDVFAFGQTPDGRSYLVMEWLQGESLRTRLERGRLELEDACQLARPLVRALTAAHVKGIVHRDLKPDNVFLVAQPGEPPTVKLLDFGIAKLLRADHQMQQTASGQFVGTPMYIAPEQARGQPIDPRADIYTFGGVLFEMLTGRPPFVAATSFEVIAKHLMEEPVAPSSVAPVPRELDRMIVAMLAKDPAARPPLADVASVLDRMADPSQRTTAPIDSARDSIASIAITSKRTPKATRAGSRAGIVAIALVVVAAVATYGVVRIVRTADDRVEAIGTRADASSLIVTPETKPSGADAASVPVIVAAPAPDAAELAVTSDAAVPAVREPHEVHNPRGSGHTVTSHPVPPPTDDDAKLLPRGSVDHGR